MLPEEIPSVFPFDWQRINAKCSSQQVGLHQQVRLESHLLRIINLAIPSGYYLIIALELMTS